MSIAIRRTDPFTRFRHYVWEATSLATRGLFAFAMVIVTLPFVILAALGIASIEALAITAWVFSNALAGKPPSDLRNLFRR